MQNSRIIKKGDIFCCDFEKGNDVLPLGIRPALVIQADRYNDKRETVIVAAIAPIKRNPPKSTNIIISDKYGLKFPSMIMLDKIQVVSKSKLGSYIGHIYDGYVQRQIDTALKRLFDLNSSKGDRISDIRCLCGRCLNNYIDTNSYVIRRVDPYKKEKEQCDKCMGMGYDYYVTEKESVLGA